MVVPTTADHPGAILAATQITLGRHDVATCSSFAEPLQAGITDAELLVFEGCSHAPIYEDVRGFNDTSLPAQPPRTPARKAAASWRTLGQRHPSAARFQPMNPRE